MTRILRCKIRLTLVTEDKIVSVDRRAKTILIVEDHEFCREAIEACVQESIEDVNILGISTIREARAVLDQIKSCDLLILDLGLSDSSGASTVIQIREGWPDVPVLILSGEDDLQLQSIVKSLGAVGFVSKALSLSEITNAITYVLQGGKAFNRIVDAINSDELAARLARFRALTGAQQRVLKAMADGALNKQIAHDLGISEITVKFHVKNILQLSKFQIEQRLPWKQNI